MHGQRGDISMIGKHMPRLQVLELAGWFEMSAKACHAELQKLNISLQGTTGIGGGPISQATLSNLLSSEFPRLQELWRNLDCDDNDHRYHLPECLFSVENVPELREFEIAGGFAEGEDARFAKSRLAEIESSCFEVLNDESG